MRITDISYTNTTATSCLSIILSVAATSSCWHRHAVCSLCLSPDKVAFEILLEKIIVFLKADADDISEMHLKMTEMTKEDYNDILETNTDANGSCLYKFDCEVRKIPG